jgi:hypothetical protein
VAQSASGKRCRALLIYDAAEERRDRLAGGLAEFTRRLVAPRGELFASVMVGS